MNSDWSHRNIHITQNEDVTVGRKIERIESGPKDRPGVTSLKRKAEEENAERRLEESLMIRMRPRRDLLRAKGFPRKCRRAPKDSEGQ